MVGRTPVLKPQEVVRLLQVLGFQEIRQKGSHKQFRHADGRCTTVPFHQGQDISRFSCARSRKTSKSPSSACSAANATDLGRVAVTVPCKN